MLDVENGWHRLKWRLPNRQCVYGRLIVDTFAQLHKRCTCTIKPWSIILPSEGMHGIPKPCGWWMTDTTPPSDFPFPIFFKSKFALIQHLPSLSIPGCKEMYVFSPHKHKVFFSYFMFCRACLWNALIWISISSRLTCLPNTYSTIEKPGPRAGN